MTSRTPKTISILGATGIVGSAALDVIKQSPQGFWRVKALTAYDQTEKLAELAKTHKAECVALENPEKHKELQERLSGEKITLFTGKGASEKAAQYQVDYLVAAISGSAALRPIIRSLNHCNILVLANKEAIVMAGHLIKEKAKKNNVTLLPADSEHNAIFQTLDPRQRKAIDKITLTASGGPFLNKPLEQLSAVTPEDTKKHPNFVMGEKICVDSASMMNKALEIIEASYLFDLPIDKIAVLIHPQQIIHGMVSYCDGSILAQMGSTDMRIPLASCLFWPERQKISVKECDLTDVGPLEFLKACPRRFPALGIAHYALKQGPAGPLIMNCANDIAVEAFLSKKISFPDIVRLVDNVLKNSKNLYKEPLEDIESIENVGEKTKTLAREYVGALS